MLKIVTNRQARANYDTHCGYQIELIFAHTPSEENYKKVTQALATLESVMNPFIDAELARLKKQYEEQKKV